MTPQDNRNLTPSELAVLRQRSVSAVLKGEKQRHVAKLFGVSQQTLSVWMKDYRERGEASFVYERRGRKVGGGALTAGQGSAIVELMVTKLPDELGLSFFLWTRAAVVELIERQHGVRITEQCAGQYLEKWDMTPQKPARRAWQQDPDAVQEWLQIRYPRIKAAAKRRGAMVLWLDEMGIRSDDQVGRTYGRRGKTPVVPVSGQRFGCNMISALSNSGSLYFKVFTERFTAPVLLDFMGRLERQFERPMVLICDGHPVHKAKAVREWLSDREGRITQEFLPPYSPELNPDEFLNQDVKTNAVRRRRPRNQQELLWNVRSYLQSTQRQPAIVSNYFLAPSVQYAGNSDKRNNSNICLAG
jgi:transposase